MKEIEMTELANLIENIKNNDLPSPILFLNVSMLMGDFDNDVRLIADTMINELVQRSGKVNAKKDLFPKKELLYCFSYDQRIKLIEKALTENQIRITHLYFIQLLKSGFFDLVFTIDLDDLPYKDRTLYNLYPSTHYSGGLKALSWRMHRKRILHIHGQYHGFWFFNTLYWKNTIQSYVPNIFNEVYYERPWVFIGYNDKEKLIDYIKGLYIYDTGLYWVGHDKKPLSSNFRDVTEVIENNAFCVGSINVDSCILSLNEMLDLKQDNINETYLNYLTFTPNKFFDTGDTEVASIAMEKVIISIIEKQVRHMIANRDFDDQLMDSLKEKAIRINDKYLNGNMAYAFRLWGNMLKDLLLKKEFSDDENLYYQAFDKFEKAILFKSDSFDDYFDWGRSLGTLAEKKSGIVAEELFRKAFEKYEKAFQIKPRHYGNLLTWGSDLGRLAYSKEGLESEELFNKAFQILEKAVAVERNNFSAYNNWALFLARLAQDKDGYEFENLYLLAIEKMKIAITKNVNNLSAYITLVGYLITLSENKKDFESDELYSQAFEYLEKAATRNKKNSAVYRYWGSILVQFASTKAGLEAEKILHQAYAKYAKAASLDPSDFVVFFSWGTALEDLAHIKEGDEAIGLYMEAAKKYKKSVTLNPDHHVSYFGWGDALFNIAQIKTGNEAEKYYYQAIEKYQEAIKLNPDFAEAFDFWGFALVNISREKDEESAELLHKEAFDKYHKAVELGWETYNLSCLYSIKRNKSDAFKYLELALVNNEISVSDLIEDEDWFWLSDDQGFVLLIEKYRDRT